MNVSDIYWRCLDQSLLGDAEMRDALIRFEGLANPAGAGAQAWLRDRANSSGVPFETQLACSKASGQILGFYAISPHDMELSRDDSAIVWVRRLRDRNRSSRRQPAFEICWIARHRETSPGFGRNLFEHAVINAKDQNRVALVVTPHDEATAELWRSKYRFMPFKKPPGDAPARLWHPVDEPVIKWP